MKLRGIRKLVFGGAGLGALLAGYAACAFAGHLTVAFSAYATGVVSIVGLVVAGNVGEHATERKAGGAP